MTGVMPRIEEIWMALAVDPEDGNEGVCGANVRGQWVPLVAADPKRLEFIRRKAQEVARTQGILVRLAKLSVREDVEKFDGRQ